MADDIEVTPAAEEPEIEAEPAPEPELDPTPEPDPEPEPEEDLEQVRKDAKAFQDQKKRAEKAEAELKKLKGNKPDAQPSEAAAPSDDGVRSRLETRGVLDEDEQNEVLEAARMLKVSPIEALTRPLVKARLEEMRAEKKAKDATPAPGAGGGRPATTTNIGLLADKVAKGGELPKDPALAEKVQNEIARRAQEGR